VTDHHAGYIITLAEDVREDDAEAIVTALRMVRGVLDVRPVVADVAVAMAQLRADNTWRGRLQDLLRETRDSTW
jgi:hypothetical protein